MLLILIFKYDQNHEGEYPEIKSGGTSLYAIAPQSLGFGFEKAKARKSDLFTDLYMRRAFHQFVLPLWPDVIFILGDYFDGGPYLSDEEWNESLIRLRHIFSLRVRDRYLNILVYYLPGNHDIGYGVLHSRMEKRILRSADGQEVMYQNYITEESSNYVLDSIKPILVLSGHDHDQCRVIHTPKKGLWGSTL
ncbi:hypothetical protein TB1_024000 [Malus domestica]